jgi:dTDP-4-dehydrorhamnose reductase
MKILVTGAGGQLAREIIAQADDVTAPDEEDLDITDFSIVSDLIAEAKPDIVINCAAFNDVDGAEENWQGAFLVNGIGVKHLALACNANNAVLMHFSSDYVFDGLSEKPYTLADMPNPINSYGQSKLLGEELVREHADRYFLIRTSWVFGDGEFSFPKKLLEWASKKVNLRIVDDQVASPTYTADLAGAALKLAGTGNFGLYHITNSGHASKFEWADFILRKKSWTGTLDPAKSSEFDTPAKRPAYSVLDNFPLRSVIGDVMPTWQDATERFLNKGGS